MHVTPTSLTITGMQPSYCFREFIFFQEVRANCFRQMETFEAAVRDTLRKKYHHTTTCTIKSEECKCCII